MLKKYHLKVIFLDNLNIFIRDTQQHEELFVNVNCLMYFNMNTEFKTLSQWSIVK